MKFLSVLKSKKVLFQMSKQNPLLLFSKLKKFENVELFDIAKLVDSAVLIENSKNFIHVQLNAALKTYLQLN